MTGITVCSALVLYFQNKLEILTPAKGVVIICINQISIKPQERENLDPICLHSPTVTFSSFSKTLPKQKAKTNMKMSNWHQQSVLWLEKIPSIWAETRVYSVTFLLCWWTLPCPLGDSGPVSRKEECYLMVPDQKPHHHRNPPLSERELEMFSFRPAAHLFWSSLATPLWTCDVEGEKK